MCGLVARGRAADIALFIGIFARDANNLADARNKSAIHACVDVRRVRIRGFRSVTRLCIAIVDSLVFYASAPRSVQEALCSVAFLRPSVRPCVQDIS